MIEVIAALRLGDEHIEPNAASCLAPPAERLQRLCRASTTLERKSGHCRKKLQKDAAAQAAVGETRSLVGRPCQAPAVQEKAALP